jgi:N-acetylmuramoyl-L-alanine amidase
MKKNSINRVIGFVIVGLVLLAAVIETGRSVYTWSQQAAKQPRYTIVIDPGHGGNDPGKIGINDVPEKDVNLAISLELKEILEQNDCRVVMTRQKDEALYQAGDTNKKVADLRARCQMINDSGADAVISIHQNSFTAESSRGAQVFYRASSQEGKKLADILQTQLVSGLDPGNRRVAKANSDYFMLKNTTATMVIVECGFLSNSKEAELLTQASYQRRVAWAVALGVLQYVSGGLS